jgi:MYXO-CTERM domain-containing protein
MRGNDTWWMAAVAALGLMTATSARAEGPVVDDRPRGTYVKIDPPDEVVGETPVQHGGAPHILFLQRCAGGLTISPGGGGSINNQSEIVGGVINFPPFPYGDGAWNQVVDITRELFAPFNVTVTDVDPGNTPHDEAVVCGDGAMAGFAGAGGVAPFSCGVINNAITFTFAETLGNNPQLIAEVIGQEAAHAWGLDHEYLCQDPMTYLSGCGPKSFQNVNAQCGEFSPRQCSCGGNTQNSYKHIINTWGAAVPDNQAPTAAITYPNDGDVFTPGAEFEIAVSVNDDVQVAEVTLFVNGSPEGADASAPFGPWPVSNIPEGSYAFHIEATDVAGNTTMSAVVSIDVTPDGEPPPPPSDDGGVDSGNPADSGDGGLDSGNDGGLDTGNGGGADGGDAGALPPGYGTGFDPATDAGCECSAGSGARGGLGTGLLLLGLLGLRVHGRRRRSSRPAMWT